jgi:hypothetical protein
VTVLAPTPQTQTVLEAADVYLDSFPFASLTSLMEAALFGTPVVCLAAPDSDPLAADDPSVEFLTLRSRQEWLSAVLRYLDEPETRLTDGKLLADALMATHAGRPWLGEVDEIYAAADQQARVPIITDDVSVSPFDNRLASVLAASGMGLDLVSLFAANGLLPPNLT